MNYVKLKILSLKYLRYTPIGCKDIGIRKSEFVTKTQFLCPLDININRLIALHVNEMFKVGKQNPIHVLLN